MSETGSTAGPSEGSGERAGVPVFVVGAPRSGTTLLSTMLDSHSQVAIAPEMHYFSKYWSRFDRALEQGGEGADALVDFFLTTPEILDMHLTPAEEEQIRARLRGRTGLTHREIYTAFVRAYADRSGKPVYGEKTPAYVLHIPTLTEIFPGCRFVCITRDPRDVSLSWRRASWTGGPVYHALMWRRFDRAARTQAVALGDRFLDVRYEDLLNSPDDVLARCCATLGVSYEPDMVAFHTSATPNFDAEREWWKVKAATPLDPANADKWKTDLPAEHVALIELVLRKDMERHGYVRSRPRLTPPLLLRMAKVAAKDLLRTYPAIRARKRQAS